MVTLPTPRDPVQEAREAAWAAWQDLCRAMLVLPRDHPAHQELDQARLAVAVALSTIEGP